MNKNPNLKVTVTVTIPSIYTELFEALNGADKYSERESSKEFERVCLTTFAYKDVYYAMVDFEDSLINLKIPFSKSWSGSSEIPSGSLNSRIDAEGEQIIIEIDDSDRGVMPVLEVKELLKKGQIDMLKKLVAKYEKETVVMGWPEQKEILKTSLLLNS